MEPIVGTREDNVQHPKPWLRFVEAAKIEDQTLDIDGMKMRNDAGDKLGKVDGMIVDAESGRTYYVVVDAGGWFKSKQFLLPMVRSSRRRSRCAGHRLDQGTGRALSRVRHE
jgi:hypothetical protein